MYAIVVGIIMIVLAVLALMNVGWAIVALAVATIIAHCIAMLIQAIK